MNAKNKVEHYHSSSINKLEWRVSELIKLYRTLDEAHKVAGLSIAQLKRYKAGSISEPAFRPISMMALDRGVSLDWLATGEGGMMQSQHQVREDSPAFGVQNRDKYLDALLLCEEVLQAKNVDLPPSKKVDLVKIVAGMMEKEDSKAIKSNIYQLVALAS